MVIVSLLLNIAVLVPVTASLLVNAGWVQWAFGERTPARDILLSIYLAILVASIALLVVREPAAVAALLGVQIVYKILSAVTVRDLRNPAVLSNLAIAVVHAITVATLVPSLV